MKTFFWVVLGLFLAFLAVVLFYKYGGNIKPNYNEPTPNIANPTTTNIVVPMGTTTIEQITNPPQIEQNKDPKSGVRVPSRYACVGEYCDGSMYGDNYKEVFSIINIPLIKDGGSIGCNVSVFLAPHTVPKTSAVLDATYRLLFDIKHQPEIPSDGFRNTVAGFDRTFFDKVTLTEGTAKVYLTGQIMSPGTCADPEFKAQIEAAAFQFDTVNKIEVYLNDKLFDWCILDVSGGEGICKDGPQYWVTDKK